MPAQRRQSVTGCQLAAVFLAGAAVGVILSRTRAEMHRVQCIDYSATLSRYSPQVVLGLGPRDYYPPILAWIRQRLHARQQGSLPLQS